MIEVIYDDGSFKAKGSFSLGVAGVFTNDDFDVGTIAFDEDLLDEIKTATSCSLSSSCRL